MKMIIKREIEPILKNLAEQYPVVAVMGPRQSGKTTVVRQTFTSYAYVTLEDIDMRIAAKEDPRKFFATFQDEKGLIIDEVQEVPELLSYMQGIVDKIQKPGFFILTGSQNFLMYEKISQTLAGRIALLTLLPLTIDELKRAKILPDLETIMVQGLYPKIYSQKINFESWFTNYIATYVERDVRQVLKITDVVSFQKFLKLCAARVGQILNYADLARDCDISPNTAKSWLSILETSYIIKLLQPYYKNFNKRVIKSPKLYFYDTGLVCSLLGIKNAQEFYTHFMRGAIFENLIISETLKYNYNQGKVPNIYFWRDVQGHEIDCIIERSFTDIIPIEIKSGMTVNPDFFKGLIGWQDITGLKDTNKYVIYAGNQNVHRTHGNIIAWDHVKKII